MGTYKVLYSICIEHGYFHRAECRALDCRPTASGAALLRRRGLLFKAVGNNFWNILYDADSAGPDTDNDTVELQLFVTDPLFAVYTRSDGLNPGAHYSVELQPERGETTILARDMHSHLQKRSIGCGLCTIWLRITAGMWSEAVSGTPWMCTVRFEAAECRWEYLLVPRNDDGLNMESLHIEEEAGRLTFATPEPVTVYGRMALRTISDRAVPVQERYDYRLKLVACDYRQGRRRILSEVLPLPVTGAFHDAPAGVLRQIYVM